MLDEDEIDYEDDEDITIDCGEQQTSGEFGEGIKIAKILHFPAL